MGMYSALAYCLPGGTAAQPADHTHIPKIFTFFGEGDDCFALSAQPPMGRVGTGSERR